MLAPRTANAFVCIRCELQLARRRLPAYARAASQANFSTSAFRHDGADGLASQSQARAPGLRIIKERRRKGKLIQETSASLGGLKQLGDDAGILVLGVVERETHEVPIESPTEPPKPAEPQATLNFLASLEEERLAPTLDDIFERLESLRPPPDARSHENITTQYIPQAAFRKLARDLINGFKKVQLEQFFLSKKNAQVNKKKAKTRDVHAAVLASLGRKEVGEGRRNSRTDWQPGVTHTSRRLPGVDIAFNQAQSRSSLVNKPLLADRIMRDLWKLVPQEEIEAPGEIELTLKDWQLKLLTTGGKDTPLKRIGATRRVRIVVHEEHIVVRVTADKTTAEYAANDIEEALKGVHSEQVRLRPWIQHFQENRVEEAQSLLEQKKLASALFSQKDLDMISSITGAVVEVKSNETLAIQALNAFAAADAKRALINLLPMKDATRRTLDDQSLSSEARLLPTVYDESSLDYQYRNTQLGRWRVNIERTSEAKGSEGQEVQPILSSTQSPERTARIVRELQESFHQVFSAESERNATDFWSEPTYRLSAEFGQILYPLKDAPSSPIFISSTTGLANLLSTAHFQEADAASSMPIFQANPRMEARLLVYHYKVFPENKTLGKLFPLPNLHIEMRTSLTGGTPTLQKISLGFEEHVHQVLLPDEAADMRFVKRGYLEVNDKHDNEDINTWASLATDNIMSGERLTAPNITMSIPKWLIPGYPADVSGLQRAEYTLAGIQFQQAVNGTFCEEPVSFTTTQSSKMSGRGGTLSMTYTGKSVNSGSEQDPTLVNFVQKCFGLAGEITRAASQTQPISKQRPRDRPRDEQGARRLKRLEQYGAESVQSAEDVLEVQNQDQTTEPVAADHDVRNTQPKNEAVMPPEDDALSILDEAMASDVDSKFTDDTPKKE